MATTLKHQNDVENKVWGKKSLFKQNPLGQNWSRLRQGSTLIESNGFWQVKVAMDKQILNMFAQWDKCILKSNLGRKKMQMHNLRVDIGFPE